MSVRSNATPRGMIVLDKIRLTGRLPDFFCNRFDFPIRDLSRSMSPHQGQSIFKVAEDDVEGFGQGRMAEDSFL